LIAQGDYDEVHVVTAILNALEASYPEGDINKVDTTSIADKVLTVVTNNADLFKSQEGQTVIALLEFLTAEDKIGTLTGAQKTKLVGIVNGILNNNASLLETERKLKALISELNIDPKPGADLSIDTKKILPDGPIDGG